MSSIDEGDKSEGMQTVIQSSLLSLADSLVGTLQNDDASQEQINAAMQPFFQALSQASEQAVSDVLQRLSLHFGMPNAARAALLATVCGAIVERGADPEPLNQALHARLASLLHDAGVLFDAVSNSIAEQSANTEGDEEDAYELFSEAKRRCAEERPSQAESWDALEQFWRPAIAICSRSSVSRETMRDLRQPAAKISEHTEAGHWLQLILSVLEDEPFLALEPATQRGIVGQFSGVVENFQLNVLLMDVFPKSGFFSRRRVSKRAAGNARGQGPQSADESVKGVWNLYTWQALTAEMSLPVSHDRDATRHWIWNEGIPEDIPVFEGHRVVLLGPASYVRSWKAQRMFDALAADLCVERELEPQEVREWLQRMAAAGEND